MGVCMRTRSRTAGSYPMLKVQLLVVAMGRQLRTRVEHVARMRVVDSEERFRNTVSPIAGHTMNVGRPRRGDN